MARYLAIMALLVAAGGGCDDRNAPALQPTQRTATAAASLDDRLLGTLDSRRQWSTNAVKIRLKNPSVALNVKSTNGNPVRLHAWCHNENDFDTAMMRLNEGDVLYAVTNAELDELRARATAGQHRSITNHGS